MGEPIYVGVLILRLDMPWVRSLKEKRSLVKPITEGLKSRFPVSVARLSGLDEHGWESIGVSAISADRVWLEGTLNKVIEFVRSRDVEISEYGLDVERWDDEL